MGFFGGGRQGGLGDSGTPFFCQFILTSCKLVKGSAFAEPVHRAVFRVNMSTSKQGSTRRPFSGIALIAGILVVFVGVGYPALTVLDDDITNLGGELSTDLPERHAIQVPAPNVTDVARINQQVAGFPVFHRITTKVDGLGPRYINNSCGGCHVNNGKGPASINRKAKNGSTMVVKLKRKGLLSDGTTPPVRGFGTQLLDHSLRKKDNSPYIKLSWRSVRGRYPDGTVYRLRKPKLSQVAPTPLPRGTITSLRMSPILIGQGLLEAIPDSTLLQMSDPADSNGDGISGRVNMVKDLTTGQSAIGRFGFKATEPTVLQQSAAALFHDMQISNPLFFAKPNKFEASQEQLFSLAVYLRLAGVPKARNQAQEGVAAGKALFRQVGCDQCHSMTLTTGTHSDPELSNQTIHPFTDLLLHDMGDALADGWTEFSATGSEWRTTPLWGLGFANQVTAAGQRPLYLHDGRARTIEEAILWHGGEAQQSQQAFRSLPAVQRQNLLDFLNSL